MSVLLLNLGSPDSTSTKDVRRYLNQFLMDRYVIDLAWPLRRLITGAFILPFRPKRSAHAYSQIWSAEGSPLVVHTRKAAEKMTGLVDRPVYWAMRYGRPSIASVLKEIKANDKSEELYVMPLYPHYTMSSWQTAVEETERLLKQTGLADRKVFWLKPFYNHQQYIDILASAVSRQRLPGSHVVFSYHGIPHRHIEKRNYSGHCKIDSECCFKAGPKLRDLTCYRFQCFETSRLTAEKMGLGKDEYSTSFQSRLGRDPWLGPTTLDTLAALAEKEQSAVSVACPSFVADCLETLEEIGMGGRDHFLESGGKQFARIDCLNSDPDWLNTLAGFLDEPQMWLQGQTDIRQSL